MESRVLSEFSEFLSTRAASSTTTGTGSLSSKRTKPIIKRVLILTQLLSTLRYLDPKDLEEAFFSSEFFLSVGDFLLKTALYIHLMFGWIVINEIVSVQFLLNQLKEVYILLSHIMHQCTWN